MNPDIPPRCLFSWNLFTLVISTLLALPKTYTIPALSPKAMFWAHMLLYFLFIDVFHGIIIPLNMLIPWNYKPSKVSEFYVRKPQISPRRPPYEESRRQIISVEEDKGAISEGCFGDSKIIEVRESTKLYDNSKPSTSYQLARVDSRPKLKPKPSQSHIFKALKIIPLEPEPFPKIGCGVADVEKGGRRTALYCRTCAKKEKGKGRGKGKSKRIHSLVV